MSKLVEVKILQFFGGEQRVKVFVFNVLERKNSREKPTYASLSGAECCRRSDKRARGQRLSQRTRNFGGFEGEII